jgi:hypothetical protein
VCSPVPVASGLDTGSDAAPGWIAVLGGDPDEDDAQEEVFAFCPCAGRELRMARTIAETYV